MITMTRDVDRGVVGMVVSHFASGPGRRGVRHPTSCSNGGRSNNAIEAGRGRSPKKDYLSSASSLSSTELARAAALMEPRTSATLPPGISRDADFRKVATRMGVTSLASAVAVAVDCDQAAPDGGKLTVFPPQVQLPATADTGTDAVR